MLAKYRHPNIILLIGAITKPPQLCLAMELVKQGSLYDFVHKRKVAFSDAEKKKIAVQMVGVISYLHRHGIVHRDIKSHNMLLDKNLTVKLCDFGLAKHKVTRKIMIEPTEQRSDAIQRHAYIHGSRAIREKSLQLIGRRVFLGHFALLIICWRSALSRLRAPRHQISSVERQHPTFEDVHKKASV